MTYSELLEDKINSLETVKEENIIDRNKDVEHIVHAASNYGKDGDKYERCLSLLVSTDIQFQSFRNLACRHEAEVKTQAS